MSIAHIRKLPCCLLAAIPASAIYQNDLLSMNIFLEHLSAAYPDDYIILVCDGAAWHKSGSLQLFPNIELMFIPPYTPEMNPIEQIWKELRARGFHNEVFQTLDKVVDRLCDTIRSLTHETIRSITGRSWILSCFI